VHLVKANDIIGTASDCLAQAASMSHVYATRNLPITEAYANEISKKREEGARLAEQAKGELKHVFFIDHKGHCFQR